MLKVSTEMSTVNKKWSGMAFEFRRKIAIALNPGELFP
jgi:hypothetical protein